MDEDDIGRLSSTNKKDEKCAHSLVGDPQGKIPPGRTGSRWIK
jgi:hypothetical protein